jgi:hypothetical protein
MELQISGIFVCSFQSSLSSSFFPVFFFCFLLGGGWVIYCFTSRSRIVHLYRDVTITGEWLQNLDLCSALKAFEQGESFKYRATPAVTRDFCSSEGPSHTVASYNTQGDVEDLLFNNSILLATQNLIGSFDFSEVFFYIVYNNLPWRHNAVEFFGVNNISSRHAKSVFFFQDIFQIMLNIILSIKS